MACPPALTIDVRESRLVARSYRDPGWSQLTVESLRTLFRGLLLWRSAMEDLGVDTIVDNDGVEWVIWDVESLYKASQRYLSPRQAQAVDLFLVHGLRECDVAILMGIAPTNPIGMYATDGLQALISGIQDGTISLRR